MILLDTDHLSVVVLKQAAAHAALMARLQSSTDRPVATTVVCVEEQCRGWLAQISRLRDVEDQPPAYTRLANLFRLLGQWEIALFDARAAAEFKRLRKQRVRIGTQDLKIACIALVNDALLLSANLRDFQKVPKLRVENWLK